MKTEPGTATRHPDHPPLPRRGSRRRGNGDRPSLAGRGATGIALALAANLACALPFTASVGTLSGKGLTESVDFPLVAEVEENVLTQPGTQATRRTYARSSSLGLGLRVIDEFTATVPEAEASIGISDLVFSLTTPGSATQVQVGLGGLLEGIVTFGGTGNAVGSLQASASLLGSGVSSSSPALYNAAFGKDRETGTARPLPTGPVVVHEQLTGSAVVELGVPVQFAATMFLRGGGDSAFGFFGPGIFSGLFDNSFRFDPDAFFDLPAGFTANSPSLGLVDNRLLAFAADPGPSATVTEPGAAALLWLGLLTVAGVRARPPSRARHPRAGQDALGPARC